MIPAFLDLMQNCIRLNFCEWAVLLVAQQVDVDLAPHVVVQQGADLVLDPPVDVIHLVLKAILAVVQAIIYKVAFIPKVSPLKLESDICYVS